MLDLAIHFGNGPMSISDIAQRQEVSGRYLENIMGVFVAAGLVVSVRGRKGGFVLAKPPEEIRMVDVVQTAEGSLAPVACVDDPRHCERSDTCVTYEVWGKVRDSIVEVLGSFTLSDMVRMHEEKRGTQPVEMYYI